MFTSRKEKLIKYLRSIRPEQALQSKEYKKLMKLFKKETGLSEQDQWTNNHYFKKWMDFCGIPCRS